MKALRRRLHALPFLARNPAAAAAVAACGLCAGLPPAWVIVRGFDEFGAWRLGFVLPIAAVFLGVVLGQALGGAVSIAALRAACGAAASPAEMARGAWRRLVYMRAYPSISVGAPELYDLVPENVALHSRPGYRRLAPPAWGDGGWGGLVGAAYLPIVIAALRWTGYVPPSAGWIFFVLFGLPIAAVLGLGATWASFDDLYEGLRAAARLEPARLPALLERVGLVPLQSDYGD